MEEERRERERKRERGREEPRMRRQMDKKRKDRRTRVILFTNANDPSPPPPPPSLVAVFSSDCPVWQRFAFYRASIQTRSNFVETRGAVLSPSHPLWSFRAIHHCVARLSKIHWIAGSVSAPLDFRVPRSSSEFVGAFVWLVVDFLSFLRLWRSRKLLFSDRCLSEER